MDKGNRYERTKNTHNWKNRWRNASKCKARALLLHKKSKKLLIYTRLSLTCYYRSSGGFYFFLFLFQQRDFTDEQHDKNANDGSSLKNLFSTHTCKIRMTQKKKQIFRDSSVCLSISLESFGLVSFCFSHGGKGRRNESCGTPAHQKVK